jgi:1-acyl-sn-glycerol-3-phosphate acyltransferase
MGTARMLARLVLVLGWTLACAPVQFVLLRLRGQGKQRFARTYWRGVARLIGLHLRVIGSLADTAGRPVIFTANHSSWLDIVALGAVLPACFIAKGEIAGWPGISLVARLGRTVFVSRERGRTGAESEALAARLQAGDNLILFPEGTTSDGARVLPFRSSFLSIAGHPVQPAVQPVTLVYDLLDNFPVCRRNRPLISWYGDMEIAAHYAIIGRHKLRATIILDPPLSAPLPDRKQLAALLEGQIAANAAKLRQGRSGIAEAAPHLPLLYITP